jgi:uncharacterized protein
VAALAVLALGTWLFARSWSARRRTHPDAPLGRLRYWPITGWEFTLLVAMILCFGLLGQWVVSLLWGKAIQISPEREGLALAAYGAGFHGFALLGWPIFKLLRHRLHFEPEPETPPPVAAPPTSQSWPKALGAAAVVLLIAYPLLVFISPGWIALLKALDLPVEVQDQVTVFSETKSQFLLAAMLFVACVLAPINEELLFRRGLYHFLRQKLHRPAAVLLSAVLFGILHMNWAGFLPLTMLGALLALAYEWTGDIRVSILTHALFNFTTVMMLFLGVPQPS